MMTMTASGCDAIQEFCRNCGRLCYCTVDGDGDGDGDVGGELSSGDDGGADA